MYHVTGSSLYGSLIIFITLVALRALFSFLETSVTALRLFKLKEIAQSTNKYRSLFQALEQDPNRILITILVASCLIEVSAATVGSYITDTIAVGLNLSGSISILLGILFTTVIILVFGDIIPKNIAQAQ